MADFRARRPLEDFFIHPTCDDTTTSSPDDHMHADYERCSVASTPPPSNMSDGMLRLGTSADDMYAGLEKGGEKRTTLDSTAFDLMKEPAFAHIYTSDEEVASPVDDNDGSSLHSASDDDEIDDAEVVVCEAVRPNYVQAHAVQMSTGKAKVVSIPKTGSSHSSIQTRWSNENATPQPQRASTAHGNRASSSTWSAPVRTQTLPILDTQHPTTHAKRALESSNATRRRSKPLQERPASQFSASQPSLSSPSSQPINTPDFLARDPYAASSPTTAMAPTSKRRSMRKLSTSFSLKSIRGLRRTSSAPPEDPANCSTPLSAVATPFSATIPESPSTATTPALPAFQPSAPLDMQGLTSPTSPKSKLVPRGASERAPTLELPPCPDESIHPQHTKPPQSTTTTTISSTPAPHRLSHRPTSSASHALASGTTALRRKLSTRLPQHITSPAAPASPAPPLSSPQPYQQRHKRRNSAAVVAAKA